MKRTRVLCAGLSAGLLFVGCGSDGGSSKGREDAGAGSGAAGASAGTAGAEAGSSHDAEGGRSARGGAGGTGGRASSVGGRSSGGAAGASPGTGGRSSGGAAGAVVSGGGSSAGAAGSDAGQGNAGEGNAAGGGGWGGVGTATGGTATGGTATGGTATGGTATGGMATGGTATGGDAGETALGGAAGQTTGGAAGFPGGCVRGDWRPCSVSGKVGDCAVGIELCADTGEWGECSIAPEANDSCTAGKDENCNGIPNEGCSCTDGALVACGPPNSTGVCSRGVSTCVDGAWGRCEGAVYPDSPKCNWDDDADCDGLEDSKMDSCVCVVGRSTECGTHPEDGRGECHAGTSVCAMPGDGSSSAWGACVDSVGPSAELCADDGKDENCDGRVNDPDVCDHVACTMISAGYGHTCAVMSDGSGRCWGRNPIGQLGSWYAHENGSTTPVETSYMYAIEYISAGNGATCILSRGLDLRSCWGTESYDIVDGVHGLPSGEVLQLIPSYQHVCALTASAAYCWGVGANGRLGQGTLMVDRSEPVGVSGSGLATQLSVGQAHACVLMPDHTVKCWGSNSSGQCGTGSGLSAEVMAEVVPEIDNAVSVAVGQFHSCAVLDDATVSCWGLNTVGQLGDGTTDNQPSPVPVLGLSNVAQVCGGWEHTCALLDDGTVRCWGGGGTTGDGTTDERYNPVEVTGISNATAITCGYYHSCALLSDGTAWCWGENGDGELGNGTKETDHLPVQVAFP